MARIPRAMQCPPVYTVTDEMQPSMVMDPPIYTQFAGPSRSWAPRQSATEIARELFQYTPTPAHQNLGVSAARQRIQDHLNLDKLTFDNDKVDNLYLTRASNISKVLDHAARNQITAPGSGAVIIKLNPATYIGSAEELCSSFPRFSTHHQRLRGLAADDRGENSLVLIGTPSSSVSKASNGLLEVPLNDIRIYSGEHGFANARFHASSAVGKPYFPKCLQSTMIEGFPDLWDAPG